MKPLTVGCPHCHDRFTVKNARYLGEKVRCPHCRATLRIPARAPGPEEGQESRAEDASTNAAAAETKAPRLPPRVETPGPRLRRSRGSRRRSARRATIWKTPAPAILASAIIGGLGSAVLYPALCASMSTPVTGVAGQIGTVAIAIGGAVFGGLGATMGPGSRGPTPLAVILISVVTVACLADIVGHLVWHQEVLFYFCFGRDLGWPTYERTTFVFVPFGIGLALRFLYDRFIGAE